MTQDLHNHALLTPALLSTWGKAQPVATELSGEVGTPARPYSLVLLHMYPQGSLHMWIDIFPRDVPAPSPVDIKPRQPIR